MKLGGLSPLVGGEVPDQMVRGGLDVLLTLWRVNGQVVEVGVVVDQDRVDRLDLFLPGGCIARGDLLPGVQGADGNQRSGGCQDESARGEAVTAALERIEFRAITEDLRG